MARVGRGCATGIVARDDRTLVVVFALLASLVGCAIAADVALGHPPPTRQEVTPLPAMRALEPPLKATPGAECGPGSLPETGVQGRVSREDHLSGRAAQGYTCNAELVGSYEKPTNTGTVGGFKVERYVDAAGHECAYYDTTLLFPSNLFDVEDGVNVLDMTDPRAPVLTERLVTPAMLSPHESLVRQRAARPARRGVREPGDQRRHRRRLRHLRGLSPSRAQVLVPGRGLSGTRAEWRRTGSTFYSASPGTQTLVAVDITNPSAPVPLWIGPYDSHGLSITDDGNRAYVAGVDSGLIILDTSEIQARVPDPTVREVARLTWESMSIPQNAIPITVDGHAYLVEIDEFGAQDRSGPGG